MHRVAIPISENILIEQFEKSKDFILFEIDKNKIERKEKHKLPEKSTVEDLLDWLIEKNITDVISCSISERAINRFVKEKINLFIGVDINSPDEIMNEYLWGTLKSDLGKILN